MKLEKLSDNKIRIIFSIQELEKQNIDYHSFMSNSIESRYMFSTLLCKAQEELDFNIDNCKISVETFELSDGNFILTITKFNAKNKKVHLKRKLNNLHTKSCIYKFANIDNFCDFCNFLQKSVPEFLMRLKDKNSLFKINSDYYLVVTDLMLNYTETGTFSTIITEFANFTNSSNSLISKFIEDSPCLIKNNAIDICLNYF